MLWALSFLLLPVLRQESEWKDVVLSPKGLSRALGSGSSLGRGELRWKMLTIRQRSPVKLGFQRLSLGSPERGPDCSSLEAVGDLFLH